VIRVLGVFELAGSLVEDILKEGEEDEEDERNVDWFERA
jgi:hypothetical protein